MKEFREDKKELEKEILKKINEFEEKYNCYICDIDLLHTGGRMMNGNLDAKTIKVEVDYKLCD